MKTILALLLTLSYSALTAKEIKIGDSIEPARVLMAQNGYKETGLDIEPTEKNTSIVMWRVDQGVLIITYFDKNELISDMSFFLYDERPKAVRKTFDYTVSSFDSETGTMTLETKKTRREWAIDFAGTHHSIRYSIFQCD